MINFKEDLQSFQGLQVVIVIGEITKVKLKINHPNEHLIKVNKVNINKVKIKVDLKRLIANKVKLKKKAATMAGHLLQIRKEEINE